jgi:hypothetical protein
MADRVASNLWWYKAPNTTPWHFDSHDNFLACLEGTKIVALALGLPTNPLGLDGDHLAK